MGTRETKNVLREWAESPTPRFSNTSPICIGYEIGIKRVKGAVLVTLERGGGGLVALSEELRQLDDFSKTSTCWLMGHGEREGIADSLAAMRRRAKEYMELAVPSKAKKGKAKSKANEQPRIPRRYRTHEERMRLLERMLSEHAKTREIHLTLHMAYDKIAQYAREMGYERAEKSTSWVKTRTTRE